MYNKVQILGPFNSGTNLILKILKQCLRDSIQLEGDVADKDTVIWKHTHIKLTPNFIRTHSSVIFIIMYRPIQTWIESVRKFQYDIQWSKGINDTCMFEDKKYNSIIHLHNSIYTKYRNILNQCDNVLFLNYYDVISTSGFSYTKQKMAAKNLSLIHEELFYTTLNRPSKQHGNSVSNSNEANEKRHHVSNIDIIAQKNSHRNCIFFEKTTIVFIGASDTNTKLIKLPSNYKFKTVELAKNKYPDKFDFTIKAKTLVVKRNDSDGGWGHQHWCYVRI